MKEDVSLEIVDSRLANAFFERASVSENIPTAISRQIRISGRKQGGLWVGGKSVLTRTALFFSPNSANSALHAGAEGLEIQLPLSSITEITVHRGLITDIVDVRFESGHLRMKCFKAKSFAAAIETARLGLRQEEVDGDKGGSTCEPG